ncbi:MAG TPA: type II 3-dehydroquinate dehydratase [Candidatus Limnocylindrales bacterium]|nr:type II 3-dehydroquinate dehydratase [Candidatus Limnocylindrales bacterium]
MARTVWVLHGPNMDLLGTREPDLYGKQTLKSIDRGLKKLGEELGLGVECFQTNHEGALIDRLIVAMGTVDGCLINPGGLTHTSWALADTIRSISVPVVEVHLTNLYARGAARSVSLTATSASGVIMGFGAQSYELGLRALASRLKPGKGRGRRR